MLRKTSLDSVPIQNAQAHRRGRGHNREAILVSLRNPAVDGCRASRNNTLRTDVDRTLSQLLRHPSWDGRCRRYWGNDQYAPSPEIIDQRTLALPLMCPFPPFMLERSRIRCACGFVRTRRKLGPQAAAR